MALYHMLDREDRDGLRLLLDHGADIRHRNAAGETPLHGAVQRGRSAAIVQILLDQGAEMLELVQGARVQGS